MVRIGILWPEIGILRRAGDGHALEVSLACRVGLALDAIRRRGRSRWGMSPLAFSQKKAAYIRFIDGDVGNCAFRNLEYVTLRDALLHAAEWTVDWDAELSDEDAALVRANGPWFAGLVRA